MPNYIYNFLDNQFSSTIKVDEKQKIGIAGFHMLAIVDQGFDKSSSIPFIPLENGSFASDHIIQNPTIINISGTVADIYKTPSPAQLAYMRAVAEIGNVSTYLPNRTRQQINAINSLVNDVTNQIRKIDEMINTGEQLFNLFNKKSASKGLTEQFIDLINALMDSDQLIQIELPYKVYENMAISNFSVRHPTELTSAIEFRITAFQVRYAATLVESSAKFYKKPSAAVSDQTTSADNKGVNKTQDVPVSAWYSTVNPIAKRAS